MEETSKREFISLISYLFHFIKKCKRKHVRIIYKVNAMRYFVSKCLKSIT